MTSRFRDFDKLSHREMVAELVEATKQNLKPKEMKGYVYILQCCDGSYYTGSTINLDKRLKEHQAGLGANHTKKRLPVTLVYYEEFQRIDEAFYREKQIQGWSRAKKEALISKQPELLPLLSKSSASSGKE